MLKYIEISKLDAAKRQLEVAIRLFFNYSDIVAIHTLMAASGEILNDLSKKQNVKLLFDEMFELIKPEYKDEIIKKSREAQNFFKHADNDSDVVYKLTLENTEFLLYFTCINFKKFTDENSPFVDLYLIWFLSKNKKYYLNNVNNIGIKDLLNRLDFSNRQQFLKEVLPILSNPI